MLGAQLQSLREDMSRLHAERGAPGPAEAAAPEPAPQTTPAPEEKPSEGLPEPPAADVPSDVRPAEPSAIPAAGARRDFPPAKEGISWRALEEQITSRWLVWLGAIALALAGTFLVKYSFYRGWIGPAVRVSLGFLLGLALIVGGEWLRRRPLHRASASVRPDYVPLALTAAGLFTAFASVYAAHALYALMPPLLAFAALAVVAFGGVALSLLQGPFVALLGLAGGYLTPILVSVGAPSAWTLFPYVLALSVSGLAVVRYMGWWWLAWAALAGATLWPTLWTISLWHRGNAVPVGLYLLATAAIFLLVRHRVEPSHTPVRSPRWWAALETPERIAWAAACITGVLVFATVRMDHYNTPSLLALAALGGMFIGFGRREAAFDLLAWYGAAVTAAAVALWHLPWIVTGPEPLLRIMGETQATIPGPIVPPELVPFALSAALFAALYGVGGFAALWGARRPAAWAGVSAATPLVLLAAAYWRVTRLEADLAWTTVALAVAALALLAVATVGRYRQSHGLDNAMAAYAAAVTAAVGLGAARAWNRLG